MPKTGKGAGPPVQMKDGRSAINSKKTSVEATGKQRTADFAKGGRGSSFGEQEASPRNKGGAGMTGKPDARGPGKQFAQGGGNKMSGFAGAEKAVAGHTSKPTVPSGNVYEYDPRKSSVDRDDPFSRSLRKKGT